MSWIDVSTEEFNNIYKNAIRLKKCPKCNNLGGEIIINKEPYSRHSNSVRIRCTYCHYEIEDVNATTTYNDTESSRIGTFVTMSGLVEAIYKAIETWNEGGKSDVLQR